MSTLELLLPGADLVEVDTLDLAEPPATIWDAIRHGDLATSPLVRALFAIRTAPERLRRGKEVDAGFRLDAVTSSPDRPGFQILVDHPPREVVVAAIGRVWQPDIPFVHVESADAFRDFRTGGFVKVGWAITLDPWGERGTRLTLEVRVEATSDEALRRFRRYFLLIGPGSRFIRRSLLAGLSRRFGSLDDGARARTLAGDELLPDAADELTDGITIAAPPEAIWPWLLQMGCRRGGYYAVDVLDNGGARSAREIHQDLQALAVGDVLPASPEGDDGFEVLQMAPAKHLVLGGLYDVKRQSQLRFHADRPETYWHVTWAFVLEPLDRKTTRLHVRARAAFSANERLHAFAIRFVHRLLQRSQLERLAARAEERLPRDDWRDVAEGALGAGIITAAFLTPFLRAPRSTWGVGEELANRHYPGDDLVPSPRWGYTHGIEIEAPAADVWPWVAQIGADRGGFYSYQWLENLAGCALRNAESVHPEWALSAGDGLRLHPDVPPLPIVRCAPGRYLIAHAPAAAGAADRGEPWVEVSWLFFLEPLGPRRCRLVSRYRCNTSDDLGTRLRFGKTVMEPIGFAMDRQMLRGLKARCEHSRGTQLLR